MDRRERNHKWYDEFDEQRMVFVFTEPEDEEGYLAEIPAKYEVCGTCEGKGSHVNPSIDGHGISPEEFAEDPDFAESYRRGDYDQPCNECHGARVVPVVDEARATTYQVAYVNRLIDEHYRAQAEYEAERRMGA
jgi:hypothetical protein